MKKIIFIGITSSILILSSCWSNTEKIDITPTKKPIESQKVEPVVQTGSQKQKIETSIDTDDKNVVDSETLSGSFSNISEEKKSVNDSSSGSVWGIYTPSNLHLSEENTQGILLAFQEQYPNKDEEVQKNMQLQTEHFQDDRFFKWSVSLGTRVIENVFAVKKDTTWKILSFGTDTPNCKWLSSLPAEMSSGCLDESASSTGSTTSENPSIGE